MAISSRNLTSLIAVLFIHAPTVASAVCSQSHIQDPVELSFFGKVRVLLQREAELERAQEMQRKDDEALTDDLAEVNGLRELALGTRNDFIFAMVETFGRRWLKRAKEIEDSIPMSRRNLEQAMLTSARISYLGDHLVYLSRVQETFLRLRQNHEMDLASFQVWNDYQAMKIEMAKSFYSSARRTRTELLMALPNQEKLKADLQQVNDAINDLKSEIDFYQRELGEAFASSRR